MPSEAKPLARPTVLIIEDDPESARLMQRALERQGYQVLHAADGPTGLQMALEKRPNLIVLDLMLPGMSGQAIADRLKKPDGLPDTPVVIVSALPPDIGRSTAITYGCDGYLPKPVSVEKFAGQIDAYLIAQGGAEAKPRVQTILIIEDNPSNARLMQRVLERRGYRVLHALDGETGLRLAQDTHPDLILLDLGLPDVDGQTVAAYLKQSEDLSRIPLVVVTAWPAETARGMITAYNCQGYIPKPIDTREFANQIAAYLSGEDN